MAGVFLSYDRDDGAKARQIALAHEKAGHSVWWDLHVHGGEQFSKVIEEALKAADAIVVMWSRESVESSWVRDEAAVGRDSGRLVPVSLDETEPPLGFRQFQTIDLSIWKGRGKPPRLADLLDSIARVLGSTRPEPRPRAAKASSRFSRIGRRPAVAAVVVSLIVVAALLGSNWRGQPMLPVVAVAPADSAPRSQALSRDLFVKLGSLAHVGASKWQLADSQVVPRKSDLVFRAGDTGSAAQPQASLVLVDGKGDGVLWSREFTQGAEADQRQQVASTAGRVLRCALEARQTGGLPPDLFKLFLTGCAEAAEISNNDPHKTAGIMQTIVDQEPRFTPAWARLLLAVSDEVAGAKLGSSGLIDAQRRLARDLNRARSIAPDLPEIKLAEIDLLPPDDYAGALERIAQAKASAPQKAEVWLYETLPLMRVGRMADAIDSAKRGSELDPLSPLATTQLILTLAWGGRIELAKRELEEAERRWAGAAALADAQWAFHSRYGDPKIAQAAAPAPASESELYFRARHRPTPENVNALVADIRNYESQMELGGVFAYSIQALGEFHRTEEAFTWLERAPRSTVAEFSYLLFRPALAGVRRDVRFMRMAKRIGLLSYWQKTDKWPDFCKHPDLPYDCKAEAAKLS